MSKIYLIPGFGEKTTDSGYKEIIELAKSKHSEVVGVNPDWNRKTITHWLTDFEKTLGNDTADTSTVIGFSFGAYIAALAAKKHSFKKILFCSISPYFKEDIPLLPKIASKILRKRRMDAFGEHEFPNNIKTPAVFIVGDKDIPLVMERVEKSHTNWTGPKKIVVLPNVEHDINHPEYIQAVIENI